MVEIAIQDPGSAEVKQYRCINLKVTLRNFKKKKCIEMIKFRE